MTAAELVERLEEAIEDAHDIAVARADAIEAAAAAKPSPRTALAMGAAALDAVADRLFCALMTIERQRLGEAGK